MSSKLTIGRFSHGRDNKLSVWKIGSLDSTELSQTLPADDPVAHRKAPWLLHVLDVNALNFCSFAICPENGDHQLPFAEAAQPVLVAVPNAIDSGDVWQALQVSQLPS